MLPSVVKDAHLNNCSKQHIMHRNISLIDSIIIVFESSPSQQIFQVALHFCMHTYESCPFSKRQDTHFLWALQAYLGVFNHITPESLLGKPDLKSVVSLLTQFFNSEKKPTIELKLIGAGTYRRFVLPLFLCIQAEFTTQKLFTQVGAYGLGRYVDSRGGWKI